MKKYLETVIEKAEENKEVFNKNPKTEEIINKAKEILSDPKFLNQKGIRSLIDEDARVCHKSHTQDFFGYKTEFIMTITAVRTGDGAYVDGTYFKN